MFNPFEGSGEQVRIQIGDIKGNIREDKEYYYYDISQVVNEQSETIGTIRVPKDTFLVDGKLLYCQEDGIPETSFKKGDAYIQLKVITEYFEKEENDNGDISLLPTITEKDYKYINILVSELLDIPEIIISQKVEGEGNGVADIILEKKVDEDNKKIEYIIVIKKTNFATLDDIPEIKTLTIKATNIDETDSKGQIDYNGEVSKDIILKEGENITINSKTEENVFVCEINAKDTHHEAKNIIANTKNATETVTEAISNNNLKINLIEDGKVKSSIPIAGNNGIQVKKYENESDIIISGEELVNKIDDLETNGLKNPFPCVFTDGTTSLTYNGDKQKTVVLLEGQNAKIKSWNAKSDEEPSTAYYQLNSPDTKYDLIISNSDNKQLTDYTGNIPNEELQIKLIETSQVWNNTTEQFDSKISCVAKLPINGINGAEVYKNQDDNFISISAPNYTFEEGFETIGNSVSLNLKVDGWTIDSGQISHYCSCYTKAEDNEKQISKGSSCAFNYENGALIVVRFSNGNTADFLSLTLDEKTVPVYNGNVQYSANFRVNTVLLFMYYNNGSNDGWYLVNPPGLTETKNILATNVNSLTEVNSIENGKVHINHINDSGVASSHLIKGENGIEITAEKKEITVKAPDIKVTSYMNDEIIPLNYGSVFTVDWIGKGADPHEITANRFNFKLPDVPSPGGDEHYIAQHVLSDRASGITPVGNLTGEIDSPIYLNVTDGTETSKQVSAIGIYGEGSTTIKTDSTGKKLIISSSQQEYGIANEETPGLIKEGEDISVDENGNVTINKATALRGDVYIDGMFLQGEDFSEKDRKNIRRFAWCKTLGEDQYKQITFKQGLKVEEGTIIVVGFTYKNTAKEPKLSISNTVDIYPIYYKNEPVPTEMLEANKIYFMVYHDDKFHITNSDKDTLTLIENILAPNDTSYVSGFVLNTEEEDIVYETIYKDLKDSIYDILPEQIFINGEDKIIVSRSSDEDNREIKWNIEHKKVDLTPGTTVANKATLSYGDKFKIPILSYDDWGHIVSVGENTLKLPSIPDYSEIPNTPKLVEYKADKGINIESDNTIVHTNNIQSGTTIKNEKTTLSYGDDLSIPVLSYDEQGHITKIEKNTIKLPSIPDYSEIPNTPTIPKPIEYKADKGISIENNTIVHTNNIQSGTTIKNEKTTLSYGDDLSIPVLSYDEQGHITKIEKNTLKLTANSNYLFGNDIGQITDASEPLKIIEINEKHIFEYQTLTLVCETLKRSGAYVYGTITIPLQAIKKALESEELTEIKFPFSPVVFTSKTSDGMEADSFYYYAMISLGTGLISGKKFLQLKGYSENYLGTNTDSTHTRKRFGKYSIYVS